MKKSVKKKKIDIRRVVMIICTLGAISCFSYFGYYNYQATHSTEQVNKLNKVNSNKNFILHKTAEVTLDDIDTPDILEEYASSYQLNQKMIGWIKIDGTKIDYPVLQTVNNDYYLDHNFNQEKDKNGSIFIDPACSIWPRSENIIIYGHNMKSGKMFGELKKYKNQSFYEKHPYIMFDTIYNKGVYQVMYVFSEVVHDEVEVTFKYYQFTDANSAEEFNSNMQTMSDMSLYDTGVSAYWGEDLITLSTCDYSQGAERFAIVAKRVK